MQQMLLFAYIIKFLRALSHYVLNMVGKAAKDRGQKKLEYCVCVSIFHIILSMYCYSSPTVCRVKRCVALLNNTFLLFFLKYKVSLIEWS